VAGWAGAACDRAAPVAPGHGDRFRILDALFETHHPGDPHHHLALLAVVGDRQGAGRGTLLLRHHHSTLDEQGIPAYLEAAGVRSASLYDREGYRPCGEPFCLPNEAFFYPMWRAPAQRGPDTTVSSPAARRSINALPVPPSATGGFVRRAPALA
jgi:GNAT superfamily N-acetyltransferase